MKTEIFNGVRYCHSECPYLIGEGESVNKVCGFDGQPLMFYDWHIAHCKESVMRQVMNENLPGIGSYWLSPEKKRVRVLMVSNKRAKDEQASIYPLTVVFTDGMTSIDQAQFWSLPLEQWKQTMNLIPPSEV